MSEPQNDPYRFRNLHPYIRFGTASDRYAGWVGQIYTQPYRTTRRSKTVAGETLPEEVMEVRSVAEFFQHFDFVEIDFTFYRPLLDEDGRPTSNFHVLAQYEQYIPADGAVLLKVPQEITARKRWLRDPKTAKPAYQLNDLYHDSDRFTRRFYEPACNLLGEKLRAFIFEHEYQRKADCPSPEENIAEHRRFFDRVPKDSRYHIEERTDRLKTSAYFDFLRSYGIGNVFSHWTYLPPLRKQWQQAGGFTSTDAAIVRLLTPLGMKYEDAYKRYHPFDKLMDEFPRMYREAAEIAREGVRQRVPTYIAVNNRAGGNAPEITRHIVAILEDVLEDANPDR